MTELVTLGQAEEAIILPVWLTCIQAEIHGLEESASSFLTYEMLVF